MIDLDDTVTAPECARLLGVHLTTVYRWVRTGVMPARRVGLRRLVIRRADLAAMIGPAGPGGVA
jgi:excisionase family DNA binding protein